METFKRGQVHASAVISSSAQLGAGVTVGSFSVVHDNVRIGAGSTIGSHCILGEPTGDFYGDGEQATIRPCEIGAGSVIRSHSIIYQGVTIGADLRTGHHVTIREGSMIGDDVQIGTGCDLQGDLTIGAHTRLHSGVFVAQLSVIEDFVWLFPHVVLANDPHPPSDTCTQGATVRRYAAVGARTLLMPGVEVGERALVGAASLVTSDVPPGMLALGSPAKLIGPASEVKCKHGALDTVYPWTTHFRRGYPDGALPAAETAK